MLQRHEAEKNRMEKGRKFNIKKYFIHCPALAASFFLAMVTNSVAASAENSSVVIDEDPITQDSGNLFGPAAGYIHPLITVEGRYSDNIYNTNNNEKSDFITTLSPGIWIAAPRTRERVLDLDPSNTAPGGLATELNFNRNARRYQSYLLYEADIKYYSSESQNDFTDHTVEGMFQYNFAGGLTLEGIDKFIRSYDEFRSDGSLDGQLEKYYSNVFLFRAQYVLSPKVRFQGMYSNFYLDYDSEDRAYRNRTDDIYALYAYYDYSPKTALFINGEYSVSSFDTAVENDADQYNIYAGMQWRYSTKTNLRARLGFVNRSLDSGLYDDGNGFAMELLARYRISEKTSINVTAASNIEVPDNNDYSYMRHNLLRLAYLQNITQKIQFRFAGYAGWRDYREGIQDDREDTVYRVTPSVHYTFTKWLNGSINYQYEDRDSNFDANDYTSNTVYARLTFSY